MAIYLEQTIAIDRGGKEAYLESVRTRLAPHLERTRGMRLVWLGSTIGSTGPWPETIELWELRDWEHYAAACEQMYGESSPDAELVTWWRDATKLRLRSRSRTLVPADFSPSLEALRGAGLRGAAFAFTTWKVKPGRAGAMLEALGKLLPGEEARGRRLVGAYEVAFTNDSAHAIWAHADLETVSGYEAGLSSDGERAGSWASLAPLIESWSEHWGYAVPGSPLGRVAGTARAKVW